MGGGSLEGKGWCAYMLNICGAKNKYSFLFIFRPFYDYSNLGYEHVPVEYRVRQAEYGIHIRVAASQEYVNPYSTCRVAGWVSSYQQ